MHPIDYVPAPLTTEEREELNRVIAASRLPRIPSCDPEIAAFRRPSHRTVRTTPVRAFLRRLMAFLTAAMPVCAPVAASPSHHVPAPAWAYLMGEPQ